MALQNETGQAELAFSVTGQDPGLLDVVRYRGTEGLCQLYRFEIDLVTEADLAIETLIGQPAILKIRAAAGSRHFTGLVSRFELTGEAGDLFYYRAELVPNVWLATHRVNSRIFQNKSTPEIVTQVLTDGGVATDALDLTGLEATYEPREYCVQYRETDYNFICRLMEEDGIWWHFRQEAEKHVLALGDSPSAYRPIEAPATLAYVQSSGMAQTEKGQAVEHVARFRSGQSVRPGAVVLNDFDFQNPKLKLEARIASERDQALEFYDYPGEYTTQGAGSRLATLRSQEFDAGRVLAVGTTNSHRFSPGLTFELQGHPAERLDGSYLLTALTHQGRQSTRRTTTGSAAAMLDRRLHMSLTAARQSQDEATRELAEALLQINARLADGDPTSHQSLAQWIYHAGQVCRDQSAIVAANGGSSLSALALPALLEDARARQVGLSAPVYECIFECTPAAVTYRPPRVTPWPVMRGTQTARVVGPQGEEIYTDEFGRVKVQFHWDRQGKFDDTSSCWIRVSHGMAGGQYGMMFLPRVGQEVIVDFLEGDPDQPIITGRVYNADHMPPYKLPEEKTKSCIKTRSSKGGEGTNEIRFEDLKDSEQLLIYAQRDFHLRVNNDRVENVTGNEHRTVEAQQYELVKKHKHSEVRLDCNQKIGGKWSMELVGDQACKVGGNHSEECSGTYTVSAGTVVIEASDITLNAGGNFIRIDGSGITILGAKVDINSGGVSGKGCPASLIAPGAPAHADVVIPGKDTRYDGGGEYQPVEPQYGSTIYDEPADPQEKPSWIEIEMVDDKGQPWANEPYEIVAPDGQTVHKGSLDEKGQAYVALAEAGMCQVQFPRLDAAAWEKIS